MPGYKIKILENFAIKCTWKIGIGCQCGNSWKVIQDVGYYRRIEGGTHGGNSGSSGQKTNGLQCEVYSIWSCTFGRSYGGQ